MKIVAISGSRNTEGQTARAMDALLDGIEAVGGEVERYFLPTMKVERCRQCEDNGWGLCMPEGRCVVKDDMPVLADRIRSADAVVVANPVYFSDLSESLRAFLERLRRICFNESGRVGIEGKPAVGVCVAGGSGNGAPVCGARLEQALKNCRLETVDVVLVRRQTLEMKLPILEMTGRWLAMDVSTE